MWISKQMKPAAATADADLGVTTISGRKAGVLTRGEVRDLPVYGPGVIICVIFQNVKSSPKKLEFFSKK